MTKKKTTKPKFPNILDGDRDRARAAMAPTMTEAAPTPRELAPGSRGPLPRPKNLRYQPVASYLGPKLLAALDAEKLRIIAEAAKNGDQRTVEDVKERAGLIRYLLRRAVGCDREDFE